MNGGDEQENAIASTWTILPQGTGEGGNARLLLQSVFYAEKRQAFKNTLMVRGTTEAILWTQIAWPRSWERLGLSRKLTWQIKAVKLFPSIVCVLVGGWEHPSNVTCLYFELDSLPSRRFGLWVNSFSPWELNPEVVAINIFASRLDLTSRFSRWPQHRRWIP